MLDGVTLRRLPLLFPQDGSREARPEPDLTLVFVPESMERLAQRQQNEQAKLAFTSLTGVRLGAMVLREARQLLQDDSRGRMLRKMDLME